MVGGRLSIFLTIILFRIGWSATINQYEEALKWLEQYNKNATTKYSQYMNANWDYQTNLTEYNKNRYVSTIKDFII